MSNSFPRGQARRSSITAAHTPSHLHLGPAWVPRLGCGGKEKQEDNLGIDLLDCLVTSQTVVGKRPHTLRAGSADRKSGWLFGIFSKEHPSHSQQGKKAKGNRSILDQFQSVFPTGVLPSMRFLPLAVMSVPLSPLQVMQIPVYLSDEIRTTIGSTVQTRNSKNTKKHKEISHVTSRVHIQHVSEGDIQQWGFCPHPMVLWNLQVVASMGFFFLVNCSIFDLI